MKKKDERLESNVQLAKSLGYTVFWYGTFAVLLYRWFFLDQTIIETIDFFLVWIVASMAQFIISAIKGTPLSYPIAMSKKDQQYSMVFISLFAGALSVIILLVFREVSELRRLVGGFLLSSFGTLTLLSVYRIIVYLWEKKNI